MFSERLLGTVRSRSASAAHHANTPERASNERLEYDNEGPAPYDDVIDASETATDQPLEGGGSEDVGEARALREGSER